MRCGARTAASSLHPFGPTTALIRSTSSPGIAWRRGCASSFMIRTLTRLAAAQQLFRPLASTAGRLSAPFARAYSCHMSAAQSEQNELTLTAIADGRPVMLFDGVCNLCSGWVQFAVARDPTANLRFAPIQSAYGQDFLRRRGLPTDLF